MKCTGRLKDISIDFFTRKTVLSLEVNEDVTGEYDKLKDKDKLAIEVKQWRRKRSLDANAYFHVLVGKIADELRISKARCKNILIGRYGQPEVLDNEEEAVIKTNVPPERMMEQEYLHCRAIGSVDENGKEIIFYKIYRGSHTYDTREMSILIDGTVQEAKDLGVETMTPDQIEEMKQKWKVEL